MNFGDKLKNLRVINKMTQKELAKALNVSLRTVSNYETKNIRPRYHHVYHDLAEIFNVSPTYLISDENDFILTSHDSLSTTIDKGSSEILQGVLALFASDEFSDDDKKRMFESIQEAYFMSKFANQKK